MHSSLTKALADRGYDSLTPVQEACSDPALANEDLLVSAQTGSGKTVGFGIAIAPTLLGESEKFEAADVPMALIVAPTRELAFQVMRELKWLYAETGAQVATCVGGMDMRDERRALARGAHIVVGTPGRLRDHIQRGSLNMSELRVIVLDEADEMLDLGFRDDLEFMLGEAPESRRTLMFSATVPNMIAKLAQKFQRDAKRINTRDEAKQHADISYQAITVAHRDQENAIFNLLRFHDAASAIVFANTRAAVKHMTARLSNRGFSVVSLSGELTQSERTNALQAMRDGRARVCVATDVAARGIDLPNLNLVVHADLPTNTESLLHRSGRTGRAGNKGISAMIVPQKAAKKAQRLLKWAKITAEWVQAPSADDIRKLDEERLLDDPSWNEEISDVEREFAEKLLERQSAEVIAAAYMRLYRAQRSAPEELADASVAEPKRADHKDFGPSTWFSLSVGRDDRAEPRWILPMVCRAGGIDKTAIGAIRVQAKETFIEISNKSVDGFMASLHGDGGMEDGVKATKLDKAPNISKEGFGGKTSGGGYKGRDDRGGREDSRGDKRGPRKPHRGQEGKPRAKYGKGKPEGGYDPDKGTNPDAGGAPNPSKRAYEKAPSGESNYAKKAARKAAQKAADNEGASKPNFGKPSGKPSGKPGGKPKSGKPPFKKGGKPKGGAPKGAPKGGKPKGGDQTLKRNKR